MATVQLTISDQHIAEVLTAFETMFPGRTTETKAEWAKARLALYVKEIVLRYRESEARKTTVVTPIDVV